MSSDDEIQHQPDVSTQKRSDDQIDHSVPPLTPPLSDRREESGADMATQGEGRERAKELYAKVMKRKWGDVIKMYEENKAFFQTAIITYTRQTALHIAISNSQTDWVKKLLDNIDALKIREMTDNRKENPLHLAASLGQLETCERLVEMDPELIGAKNVEGETPLFLAVLHGKNEAFYALHPKCPITGKDIKHAKALCKRNDGNTILHLSIRGEYFGLAYQIIHWYPELIKDVNQDGKTALHLLAENPSSFRSGCYLGLVDYFIYSCLIVDLDKVGTPSDFTGKQCVHIAGPVPKNYQTCLDLLNLGKSFFKLIVTCARIWEDIDSKNNDRLPVTSTIPGERQETSKRDPIQESSKHCQREHIVPGHERQETSNRDPIQDSSKHCQREHIDGKKWKEIMELMQKIIPGIQAEKVSEHEGAISPLLVAAKNGVVEIVEEILQEYSLAIYDEDADKKNVFMLAVENRQQDIYNILRKKYCHQSIIFRRLDKDGNSAIHLAATTGQNQPWPIPGAALQMQWELKWYKFVMETMPHNIFTTHRNKEGRTSTEVFKEAHKTMLKEGVQWLTNTAQSCSVVAALVATVAYASATTVPGGVEKGIPLLRNTYAFSIFTISSLVALCLSVTTLTMFLSILTSRNEISDFHHNQPMKLIMGLSSLFISIAAMLVSFCAGHFFDLGDRLQHTAFPIYAVTCLPVSIYAVTQFPLYFDLIKSIIITVPKRNN